MPETDRQRNRPPLRRRNATGDRPRVLFVSCHLPWPPLSGGRRRELELISRICERFAVRLLVISKTAEQDQANAKLLASSRCRIEVFPALAGLTQASAGQGAHQVLRHRSPAGSMRIREIIGGERVDLVHVEGFYLMQHVPEWVDAPVLLVEQNIEYELDRQRAHSGGKRITRLDSFSECVRTQAAELECWKRADRLATVTWEDRELIREQIPDADVAVVPDGADHLPARHAERSLEPIARSLEAIERSAEPIERPSAPLVTLLANFGYAPNVDAALHFCQEILPSIRAEMHDINVWLVGNAPPREVRALADERVTVTGSVPDVRPYLDAADVIVCPLRIGGGIKVKMIEALRRGKAIVSTGIGAQGLPAGARSALLVAEDPREFAHTVATLLRDEPRRRLLERRAAAAAMKLPTWDESGAVLAKVYDELLDRSAAERKLADSHLAGRSA